MSEPAPHGPHPQRASAKSLSSWASGWRAPVLGLLLGVSSTGMVHTLGSDPGALAWGLALPLLGMALARHAAPLMPPVVRSLLGLVGLTALALPGPLASLAAAVARGASMAPSEGLTLALACWLVAAALALLPFASRSPATPAQLALTASCGLLACLIPPWAALLPAMGIAAADLRLRAPARQIGQPPPPSATLAFVILGVLGGWSAAFVWTGLRAWLDPTPLGWWLAATTQALAFCTGWALARPGRPGWGLEPIAASLGVGLAIAALPIGAPAVAASLPDLLQSWDPRLLLPLLLAAPSVATAALLGFACPSRSEGPMLHWPFGLAVAAGLVLGTQGGTLGATLLPLAAVMSGVLVLLVARRPMRRLAGLAGAILLALGWWQLPRIQVTPLVVGWTTAIADSSSTVRHVAGLARSEWQLATWGPEGTTSLRWIDDAMVADVDGFPLWSQGRNPAAVRFAAHLPALLAREGSRFLVLGDELGWGTITLLAQEPRTIDVAIAQPELLRAVAASSEDTRRALLAPEIQLHSVPAGWLLRQSAPVDGILQVQLRPRSDSGAVLLQGPTLDLARTRLAPGGVYVVVISIDRVPEPELRSLLGDFAETFPRGMACLPPSGVDHLILVGGAEGEPPPLARIEQRFPAAAASLATLGLTEAGDVADRCVFTSQALATWSQRASASYRWPGSGLPDTLRSQPAVHVAGMKDLVGDPDEVWDTTGAPELAADLSSRHDAVRHFLELLERTSTGDMEGLFERAKALQASTDGTRELETLITPHLARAREAMDRARKGGIQHRDWQEALNQLTLARMLHPAAVEPRLLEAMVHEARRDNRKAERLYRGVLDSQGDHLQALFGVARIQISEGRETEAEATLLEAVEAHPREAATHQVLGVALMRFGRLEDAEPELLKAAALAPDDQPQPQAALAELYLAQERPNLAQAHAEVATGIEPSAYHYTLVGRCHFELGRESLSERAYSQAVLIDPEFYPPRLGLAHLYTLRGDYNQAADTLRGVLALDPDNEAARVNLQEVERLRGLQQSDPRLALEP